MTLVSKENLDAPAEHVGDLRLRRFRLGELTGSAQEEVSRHLDGCGACRARLDGVADEQAAFEREIPFPRFAGGVERAHRVPAASRPEVEWKARPRRRFALYTAMSGMAAAAVLALFIGLPHRPDGETRPRAHNTVKGGPRMATVRVAGSGQQRTASTAGVEPLRPGERLRLGYRTDVPAYVAALSIDDAGTVTPLYPEHGQSLPAQPSAEPTYLPDALELTGHGRERVYLVMTDAPVAVDALATAVKTTFTRAGSKLDTLPVPSIAAPGLEVHSWLFEKP